MKHSAVSLQLRNKKKTAIASAVALALVTSSSHAEIEEVFVTATKREASVQDLAISVTAISGEQLTDFQIVNVLDLDKTVPGMLVKNAGNDPVIIMRGAGAAGTNDVAVPVYVDGLYRPRFGQALASYLDIERVEILRGPQGTLFGRNTLGGLINIIAKKPSTEAFEYGGAVTGGDYDLRKVEGFVNVPMGEKVALRVTASDTKRDPYVENIFRSDGGLKDADNTYARAQLAWDVAETFDVTFSATYWKDEANGNADFAYKVLGIPVNPATNMTNGLVGVLEPRQGTSPTGPSGRSQAGDFPTDPASGILPPYQIATDIRPFRDIEETSFSAAINWQMGFADLRANLGIFDYEELRAMDSDISPNPSQWATLNPGATPANSNGPGYWQQCWSGPECGILAGNRRVSKAVQADVNLNSNASDGPLQWTLGFFLYDDSGADSTDEFVWGYIDAADPQQVSWAHWLSQTNGGTKSTAIYGQAEYSLTDRSRVTAGLRRSKDERDTFTKHVDFGPSVHQFNASYYQDHMNNPGSRFDAWPSFALTDATEIVKGDDTHTDWRLAFQYDLTDDLMLYASGATGYIAGTSIGGGSTELNEPNEVESFELGMKSTLLGGSMRLNAALYHNDFDGLSTTRFVQQGGTIIAQLAPGGSMKAKGLEVEMNWQATDALNLTAGLGVDRSELGTFSEPESRFAEGGTLVDPNDPTSDRVHILNGLDARFSPDFTLSAGASYDFGLSNGGRFVPGVFIYHSEDYKTQNVPYFFAHQDAYTTVDLRGTWYSANEKLTVQAFAKNLTDEEYLTETTVFSGNRAMADYGFPRTWGVRLSYGF